MKCSQERQQFLFDIFVTALEGSIGYWAESLNYHWRKDDGSDDLEGFYSDVIDAEEGESEDACFQKSRIDISVIRKGLTNIGKEDFKINSELKRTILHASIDNDGGQIDAEGADCIVQAGLFGELVFG